MNPLSPIKELKKIKKCPICSHIRPWGEKPCLKCKELLGGKTERMSRESIKAYRGVIIKHKTSCHLCGEEIERAIKTTNPICSSCRGSRMKKYYHSHKPKVIPFFKRMRLDKK